ncbi:MAG: dihydropteroate synthase [Candidatus Delongbacteria bacterium]|nr:dihydropteroate synthase [Candidatus Delongbacteria bacterium]
MEFKARNYVFDLKDAPVIMGILNITPDSFSDGGNFINEDKALFHCEKMILEGADAIDIGGESSRPGSERISVTEELDRISNIVEKIKTNFDICLSVDTYKPEVAEEVLNLGADIINDITGLTYSEDIAKLTSKFDTGLCLMHMKADPKTMQVNVEYDNIISEIKDFLQESVNKSIAFGMKKGSIIIDPGIGFGKDLKGNLTILNNLNKFTDLGCPILIGTSRKSFIGQMNGKEVNERLNGTIASNVIALINGARIFRVHDVKENKDALFVTNEIIRSGEMIEA